MLVNIRRALVPFAAVRAFESRLLPAIVLHVGLQRFLVSVAGIASGTMIRHFSRLPEWSVFVLDLVLAATIIHPQDVHDTGVVRLQESSYEQEEGEPRLVWITNTGRAWRNCGQNRKEHNRRHEREMNEQKTLYEEISLSLQIASVPSQSERRAERGRRSSRVERGPSRASSTIRRLTKWQDTTRDVLWKKGDNVAVLEILLSWPVYYIHQKNLGQVKYEENRLFAVDSSGTISSLRTSPAGPSCKRDDLSRKARSGLTIRLTGVSTKSHLSLVRDVSSKLRSSWLSITDTPGCCCLCDAFWCACKCWMTFCLSFRSKDTGTSALFHTHACNVSACCSSCWRSYCIADRSIAPYARLRGASYGILKKEKKTDRNRDQWKHSICRCSAQLTQKEFKLEEFYC